jgi:hypothetical protein
MAKILGTLIYHAGDYALICTGWSDPICTKVCKSLQDQGLLAMGRPKTQVLLNTSTEAAQKIKGLFDPKIGISHYVSHYHALMLLALS